MTKFDKIVIFIKGLMKDKFSGSIKIIFHEGGIRGIKKVKEENIEIL